MNTLRTSLTPFVFLLCCLMAAGCTSRSSASARTYPTPGAPAPVEHVVANGETLSSIAESYGVTVATVVLANNLHERMLTPGQRLTIPGGRRHATPVIADEPAPVASSASWYIARDSWAARPIMLERTKPMGGVPIYITVHHSDSPGDTVNPPEDELRQFDRNHQDKGWACIGYHFIIAPDGRVFEGRPLSYQGAHAGWDEVNRLNIGVCLLGDFEHHRVPEIQRERLFAVLDRLCAEHGIDRGHVYGHKHFKNDTDCPGRYLASIVEAYATSDIRPASSTRLAAMTPATPR